MFHVRSVHCSYEKCALFTEDPSKNYFSTMEIKILSLALSEKCLNTISGIFPFGQLEERWLKVCMIAFADISQSTCKPFSEVAHCKTIEQPAHCRPKARLQKKAMSAG